MPSVHHQIADAARASWESAAALLFAARIRGAAHADLDALADYADEQRDHWLRADQRARRDDDRMDRAFSMTGLADDIFAEPEAAR